MTAEQAAAFAAAALANVTREFPRHVSHLLSGPAQPPSQRTLHPAFYGSYDWHSAVHMHWTLARVLRLYPALALAKVITERLDAHLSAQSISTELQYFTAHGARTFERPYGWAWLLELQAELLRLGNARWSAAVEPLADELAQRMAAFVQGAPYPIRAGTHGNTAFACLLALDYARMAKDATLENEIKIAAQRWYRNDRNAPLAYEPSLDEFLSPALVEAALMREVVPRRDFDAWMKAFLPSLELEPPKVADRADPKQSHLDGLALSRAWCLMKLGYKEAAQRQLAAALPHVVGGHYVGEHWLASFATLALSVEALKTP
ncbi:MAG TPA: DUF2891 domain-containing protein [Burkholderiales bacterium]|nr:DUF2891 domain-containing protein [Burkholderiales bacterium]